MPDENQLTPAERELELHLAALQPARHGIKPETVFFRAGQETALRQLRCWQAASTLLLLTLVGFWWLTPPSPSVSGPLQVVVQDHRAPAPQPAADEARSFRPDPPVPLHAPGTREYLRLRTAIIIKGLEVLPSPRLAPSASRDAELAVSDWRLFAAAAPAAEHRLNGER